MLIGMAEVRALKWCRKGAKDFCDFHGIDWEAFRTTGVPEEVMSATGDPRALQLIEKAKTWAAVESQASKP